MTFNAVQTTACSTFEHVDGKVEQVNQRLWSTGPTSKGLQLCARRANLGHVPLGNLASIEHSNQLAVRLSPAFLGIMHNDYIVRVEQLVRNLWQLCDVLTLYRKAYTCATEQNHHGFVKGLHVIHGNVATVVASGIVSIKSWTSGHQHTHTWHYRQRQDGIAKLFDNCGVVNAGSNYVVHVAIYSLCPSFSTTFFGQPTGIAGQCDKVLVLSRKQV